MSAAASARDPRVVRAAALLREPGDDVCLDGPELVEAALAEGLTLEYVLAADPGAWEHTGAPVAAASPDALRALGALGQPATVVAVAERPPPGRAEDARLVLADIADAGNVGSIVRTFAALGWQTRPTDEECSPTVAVVGATADPMSRRALRASAGAALRPGLLARAEWHDLPHPLVAAVPRGGDAPHTLPHDAVIVLGNERDGLRPDQLARCDGAVTIPAPGFESLNVAAAAAILIWEGLRRA